ncbi:hypothetical protein BJV74DRAFT_879576 [Russula compacta]|nr:hypothetical protein BJV74DRAFT_879576 [Russula compacta]
MHPNILPPKEASQYKWIHHQYLTAKPCTPDGIFLKEPIPDPEPVQPPDVTPKNPWAPFPDRLAFDWAQYHYVRLQSSVDEILEGLDIWRATVIKHESKCRETDHVPWKNAQDLYETLDSVKAGDVNWKTFKFCYSGPKPHTPPQWMEETYDLNAQDALFEMTPYEEYDHAGHRVFSNLMSGYWANQEANKIATDASTYGAMLVPVVAGSNKTTVSVATGHQEYHPVYASPGNISNTAHRGHGNAVLPIAFLPIPKSMCHVEFQKFCRQLYHLCLEFIFSPLKPYMEKPKIIRCPNRHFCHTIFSLGPYIADYPEQVWLAGVVSHWCPKCDALPMDLDGPENFLIKNFDPEILWDDFGIQHDIVPFTHAFPQADIHELLAPDLLHQLIKGTFKDHLVAWVMDYLHVAHGEMAAFEIIEDIDHHISAVPSFPGLQQFPDGQDYNQWTGNDSKALMKVFLIAIAGYIPSAMVQSIASFMDAGYIAHRNAITAPALEHFHKSVEKFHELQNIFIEAGIRDSISLPHQHALKHFYNSIHLFGSPNGLCSSITESKHIKAVKEPWRQSSQYQALIQMLQIIVQMEKMTVLHWIFSDCGMLIGTTSSYMASIMTTQEDQEATVSSNEEDEEEDGGAIPGDPSCNRPGACPQVLCTINRDSLHLKLAAHISQPKFPLAFYQFLSMLNHPDQLPPLAIDCCPRFEGDIKVHHSAIATFYAPSDLCGADDSKPGMKGMEIGHVLLFFSFCYHRKPYSCAFINWFVHDDEPDADTEMWTVQLECDQKGEPMAQVIPLETITCAAHLLPIYGSTRVPDDFSHHDALDSFSSFFVNHFVDHHTHEFITSQ